MKKIFILLLISLLLVAHATYPLQLHPHEQWWNNIVANIANHTSCYTLYGDIHASSRTAARHYLATCDYTSILDIPCGFCTEYFGLQQDSFFLAYYGVDIAEMLVLLAQEKGLNVIRGSIEQIPHPDSFVDICYARHIFEHIPYYDRAISELIRVARTEVLIVFSQPPWRLSDRIRWQNGIYVNRYNKNKLEQFCRSNKKVTNIVWQKVTSQETILHIYL